MANDSAQPPAHAGAALRHEKPSIAWLVGCSDWFGMMLLIKEFRNSPQKAGTQDAINRLTPPLNIYQVTTPEINPPNTGIAPPKNSANFFFVSFTPIQLATCFAIW